MSVKKFEDIIREQAAVLEAERDDLLRNAEEAADLSKKIELYTATEIASVTVRSLYTCIGQIQSAAQTKSAEDVVGEYIADLEKNRKSLLKRASDNVHISKKIELYRAAKSVSRTFHSLHVCTERFMSETPA